MRRALVLLTLLCGCGGTSVPTGFGVNLTISESQLTAAQRSRITIADVTVTGDEMFIKTFDMSLFRSGEGHVHYTPGVTSGTLTFAVNAEMSDGTVVSSGESGPVVLRTGTAVSALVTLGAPVTPPDLGADLAGPMDMGKAAGATCTGSDECGTPGGCVDGVCCNDTTCPACMNCGASGACTVVVKSAADTTGTACSGTSACDATGACKMIGGMACMAGTDCGSGNCADGVCCDKACTAVCQTCALPGKVGTCSPVVSAEDDSCKTSATGVFVCDATSTCVAPHLIKDINLKDPLMVGNTLPSSPHGFAQGPGTQVFFAADDYAHGDELWVTDGTAPGTRFVADIYVTNGVVPNGNSDPAFLTTLNNAAVYFRATNQGVAPTNTTVWKSDGTPGSASPVNSTLSSLLSNPDPTQLTVYGNQLAFVANGTSNALVTGFELWLTDGTTTKLAADILPGNSDSNLPLSSMPTGITQFNNSLYFAAEGAFVGGGAGDNELWRWNGTNMAQVTDINAGTTNSSNPTNLFVAGNIMYFSASTNSGSYQGAELWRTDGALMSTTTTYAIADINPGAADSSPGGFVFLGNTLYFSATDVTHGTELWKTDGVQGSLAQQHTQLVADIVNGAGGSNPRDMTVFNNMIYFSGIWSDGTTSLLKTDGTTVSKVTVNPLLPGGGNYANTDPTSFAVFANKLFFRGTVGQPGMGTINAASELWFTDGTITARACQGLSGCYMAMNVENALIPVGNRLYFPADIVKSTAPNSVGAELFSFP